MSQEKNDKLITLVANILGKLYNDGNVSASYIIEEHDRVFDRSSTQEDRDELIEYFIQIMRNNSLLIYNKQEKMFYYRPNKL